MRDGGEQAVVGALPSIYDDVPHVGGIMYRSSDSLKESPEYAVGE